MHSPAPHLARPLRGFPWDQVCPRGHTSDRGSGSLFPDGLTHSPASCSGTPRSCGGQWQGPPPTTTLGPVGARRKLCLDPWMLQHGTVAPCCSGCEGLVEGGVEADQFGDGHFSSTPGTLDCLWTFLMFTCSTREPFLWGQDPSPGTWSLHPACWPLCRGHRAPMWLRENSWGQGETWGPPGPGSPRRTPRPTQGGPSQSHSQVCPPPQHESGGKLGSST